MSQPTAMDLVHHAIPAEEAWAHVLSHDAAAAYREVEAARLRIATVNLIDSFGVSAAKYLTDHYGEPLLHRVLSQRHAFAAQNGPQDAGRTLPKLELEKLEIGSEHLAVVKVMIAEVQAEREARAGLVDDVSGQVKPTAAPTPPAAAPAVAGLTDTVYSSALGVRDNVSKILGL